ncbi:MAG: hypothetical protein HRU35_08345 [Rickettsiaceae bacterium]|nr:hypothetical protein [Rickettsiaceae bacterium]
MHIVAGNGTKAIIKEDRFVHFTNNSPGNRIIYGNIDNDCTVFVTENNNDIDRAYNIKVSAPDVRITDKTYFDFSNALSYYMKQGLTEEIKYLLDIIDTNNHALIPPTKETYPPLFYALFYLSTEETNNFQLLNDKLNQVNQLDQFFKLYFQKDIILLSLCDDYLKYNTEIINHVNNIVTPENQSLANQHITNMTNSQVKNYLSLILQEINNYIECNNISGKHDITSLFNSSSANTIEQVNKIMKDTEETLKEPLNEKIYNILKFYHDKYGSDLFEATSPGATSGASLTEYAKYVLGSTHIGLNVLSQQIKDFLLKQDCSLFPNNNNVVNVDDLDEDATNHIAGIDPDNNQREQPSIHHIITASNAGTGAGTYNNHHHPTPVVITHDQDDYKVDNMGVVYDPNGNVYHYDNQ